eukprot:TRINITY_DN3539_c0_g1_i1.p1 TRINITY_DN3539_c0_g1~~TRINITY_DN3539_c0_g1_i1.p1  ORF type:complete len:1519 (+),score=602.18 TRINITY_DN3539_c0_g1_i1:171-4559(+)
MAVPAVPRLQLATRVSAELATARIATARSSSSAWPSGGGSARATGALSERRCAELRSEVERIRKERLSAGVTVTQNLKAAPGAGSMVAALTEELTEARARVIELEAENDVLRKDRAKLSRGPQGADAGEVESALRRCADADAALKASKRENEELLQKIRCHRKLEEAHRRLQEELSATRAEAGRLSRAEARASAQRTEIEDLEDRLRRRDAEVERLYAADAAAASLRAENDRLQSDAEAEREEAARLADGLRTEIDRLQRDIAAEREEVRELVDGLRAGNKQLVDGLRAENERLQAAAAAEAARAESLAAEHEKRVAELEEGLREDAGVRDEVRRLETDLEAAIQESAALRAQCRALQEDLERADRDRAASVASPVSRVTTPMYDCLSPSPDPLPAGSPDRDGLARRVASLEAEREALARILGADPDAVLDAVQRLMEDHTSELDRLRQEAAESEARRLRSEEGIRRLQETCSELAASEEGLRKQVRDLEGRLDEADEALRRVRAEGGPGAEQLAKQLSEKERELTEQSAEVAALLRRSAQDAARIEELEGRVSSLLLQGSEDAARADQLQAQVSADAKRRAELQSQIEDLGRMYAGSAGGGGEQDDLLRQLQEERDRSRRLADEKEGVEAQLMFRQQRWDDEAVELQRQVSDAGTTSSRLAAREERLRGLCADSIHSRTAIGLRAAAWRKLMLWRRPRDGPQPSPQHLPPAEQPGKFLRSAPPEQAVELVRVGSHVSAAACGEAEDAAVQTEPVRFDESSPCSPATAETREGGAQTECADVCEGGAQTEGAEAQADAALAGTQTEFVQVCEGGAQTEGAAAPQVQSTLAETQTETVQTREGDGQTDSVPTHDDGAQTERAATSEECGQTERVVTHEDEAQTDADDAEEVRAHRDRLLREVERLELTAGPVGQTEDGDFAALRRAVQRLRDQLSTLAGPLKDVPQADSPASAAVAYLHLSEALAALVAVRRDNAELRGADERLRELEEEISRAGSGDESGAAAALRCANRKCSALEEAFADADRERLHLRELLHRSNSDQWEWDWKRQQSRQSRLSHLCGATTEHDRLTDELRDAQSQVSHLRQEVSRLRAEREDWAGGGDTTALMHIIDAAKEEHRRVSHEGSRLRREVVDLVEERERLEHIVSKLREDALRRDEWAMTRSRVWRERLSTRSQELGLCASMLRAAYGGGRSSAVRLGPVVAESGAPAADNPLATLTLISKDAVVRRERCVLLSDGDEAAADGVVRVVAGPDASVRIALRDLGRHVGDAFLDLPLKEETQIPVAGAPGVLLNVCPAGQSDVLDDAQVRIASGEYDAVPPQADLERMRKKDLRRVCESLGMSEDMDDCISGRQGYVDWVAAAISGELPAPRPRNASLSTAPGEVEREGTDPDLAARYQDPRDVEMEHLEYEGSAPMRSPRAWTGRRARRYAEADRAAQAESRAAALTNYAAGHDPQQQECAQQ